MSQSNGEIYSLTSLQSNVYFLLPAHQGCISFTVSHSQNIFYKKLLQAPNQRGGYIMPLFYLFLITVVTFGTFLANAVKTNLYSLRSRLSGRSR